MLKLYALPDQNGTASFETCLCDAHLNEVNKKIAVAAAKEHFVDCQTAGVGHPDNEVTEFDSWQEVVGWPRMECIVCGSNANEDLREPYTDYRPYETE